MLSILDEIITRDGGDCEFHFDYLPGILASLMAMRTLKRFQVGDIGGLFVTSCTDKITMHKRASLGKRNRAGKMSMKAIFKCTMQCHVWLQSAMSTVHRKALH
ncbi:hypothetical protein Peur_071461 [Populus x canadensis]